MGTVNYIASSARSDRRADPNIFGIAEMASVFQVSPRTLRFYEERGLLEPVREGVSRFYGPHDRIRLELILKGKRLGLNLHEIGRLITRSEVLSRDVVNCLDAPKLRDQIGTLERRRAEIEAAIEDLKRVLATRVETAGPI